MVALAVGKQCHYLLSCLLLGRISALALMTQAYVASLTVMTVGLAKVAEQLTAATHAVVSGIIYHGVYACLKLLAAVLVHLTRNYEVFSQDTVSDVSDKRHGALRNEVQDMSFAQTLEYEVNLLRSESGELRQSALLYIPIVDEESAILAQCGCDDGFLVGTCRIKLIQLVALKYELHACTRVGLGFVLDVSGTCQYA